MHYTSGALPLRQNQNNHMSSDRPQAALIENMTCTITSERPIADVQEKMPALCERHKFALLQTYVYHEIVESKGFPIERPVYIFEICQARLAAAMLTRHPIFSVFMPCRIAIYSDNEKTVIATMNMEGLLEAIRSDKTLYEETKNVFNSILLLMDELRN